MPAQLKEVRNRINSVKNTQQITKAMKMVSAAKLRKAQTAIQNMRPYANKMQEILNHVLASVGEEVNSDYVRDHQQGQVLLVLITSDKGLCGSFNSNLIKRAKYLIENDYKEEAEQGKVTIMGIGKKGYEYYKSKYKLPMIGDYRDLFLDFTYQNSVEAAEHIMQGYRNKQFRKVELIYSQFKNAATQYFQNENFLPIQFDHHEGDSEKEEHHADYIFEPNQQNILQELIPNMLRSQFYKALLDNSASEHGARMTAMDTATENADDILRELRLTYNRARQAAITTELSEIVSGANALEEG